MGPDSEPLSKNYKILVRFLDGRDELLFSDDHEPSPATSSWVPGSTIEYARTVFIPSLPYEGTAFVEVGLYDTVTKERLPLAGEEGGAIARRVARMELRAPAESDRLIYKEGWYGIETSQEPPHGEWRWTSKEAVCSFKNPRADAVIYLRAGTQLRAFHEPPLVTIHVGAHEVARFQIERTPFVKKIQVRADLLGKEDWVDLRLVSDQVFVPANQGGGSDKRSVALRVFNLHVTTQPYVRAYDELLDRIRLAPLKRPERPYRGEYLFRQEWDFFTHNIPVWEKALADFKGKPDIHYLEIGVLEGRSAIWVLENVLTHPSARLTGIDPFGLNWAPFEKRFWHNVKQAGATEKVTMIVGYSQEELRKLPLESFDIIYIDGSHAAADVLEDAILSWRLLKPAGVLIFDDYPLRPNDPPESRPLLAINIFVNLYGGHFETLCRDYQVILRKNENHLSS